MARETKEKGRARMKERGRKGGTTLQKTWIAQERHHLKDDATKTMVTAMNDRANAQHPTHHRPVPHPATA